MTRSHTAAAVAPSAALARGEVPALDGLRAISVLIVMVSHSGLGWIVPGGFGVTLFFFISGFIITTLLLREQTKAGRIDVGSFYVRRAFRLYPALAVFIAGLCLALAIAGIPTDAVGVAGGLLYFMNYLVVFAPGHVLQHANHLWSLAVEAHFYVVYPLLFAWAAPRGSRLIAALVAACAAALAVRVGAVALIGDPRLVYEYAYQASEARFDSIAFGALAAALLMSPRGVALSPRLTHPATVALSLALIAVTLIVRNALFRDTLRYTLQGIALMSIVTALVVDQRYARIRTLLDARPAVYVGWLSYSLYLWHLPALALGWWIASGVGGAAIGWLAAFALAAASFHFVEQPMLRFRARFGSAPRHFGSRDKEPEDMLARSQTHTGTRAAGHDGSKARALAHVDGWPIHLADAADCIGTLTQAMARGEAFSFCPLNLDLLVKARNDAAFAKAMRRADYIIADGWPIAMLARRHDRRVERTTGADLIVPLAKAAAEHKVPVYLFGTSPQVLAAVEADLAANCPGLEILGSESPPLGFDPTGPVADAAIARIRASGAGLCFLALGAPKQEILAARALEQGVRTGFVCVGAGLDFIAGAQVRAPEMMRNNGMEWLWRLATNPRRLAMRYAACAVHLARITTVEPALRWLNIRSA